LKTEKPDLKNSLAYFILLLCFFRANAQIKIQKEITAGFNLASNTNTPFLIRANRFGTVPFKSGVFFISPKIQKDYDSLYSTKTKRLRTFDYGFAIEPHINLGAANQILLPQAYIKARWRAFEFLAGRRKEIVGLVDTTNTMGSYSVSGNALPIPKVEISLQNYTPILGNGLVSIKGNFAHGWFGSSDSVQKFFLHQKSLYVRIGKPEWKAKLFFGLNHNVQWGGRPTKPYYDETTKKTVTSFGNDFATFFNMVTGVRLSKFKEQDVSGSGNEAFNRVGNHLGSVDVGVEVKTHLAKILIYRQNLYEDGSLYYLNNIEDGLNGISISNLKSPIKKITFEYLNTSNQGGNYFSDRASELRGQDNYFNNSIYSGSWRYKGNTVGNALLNNDKLQAKQKEFITNNRVQSIYIGLDFSAFNLQQHIGAVLNRNYGTYGNFIDLRQNSFVYTLYKNIQNIDIRCSLSSDVGSYYTNSVGFSLLARKRI
jgi:Capsule assembly protein Wzi